MTQEEAVMKRLTVEELADLERLRSEWPGHTFGEPCDTPLSRYRFALVEHGDALLAMASRLVELESHDAPLDVPFGCDPGDSAALEKLRMAIDDADVWPSEAAKEAGDYEAAVAHMAGIASRLVEVESALSFISEFPGEIRSAAPMAPELIAAFATGLGWTSPTQKPNDGGRDG